MMQASGLISRLRVMSVKNSCRESQIGKNTTGGNIYNMPQYIRGHVLRAATYLQ